MALNGVKVLDLSRFQNGPYATCLLQDVGAEVIKLEMPGVGDTGRGFMSHRNGFSGYNESLNRGKKSIELDLKNPAARPVVEKLIKWADVVVENYKVGVLDRLGYSYEYMKGINPSIILCANSGFGPEGPWSERGSFDVVCQAMSGAMVSQGGGPAHTPQSTEWGLGDQVGALNFAFHIAAALVARSNHPAREGQKLECSQLGAMVQFQSISNVGAWYNKVQAEDTNGMDASDSGAFQRNDGQPHGLGNVLLSQYQCGDGKWLTCAPSMEERHYVAFCHCMALEDMLRDPRTAELKDRWKNQPWYRMRIEERFQTAPRDHWLDVLAEAGVPVGPVLDYAEISDYPQMRANGYVQQVTHPVYGRVVTTGVPARYSGTPAPPVANAAPDLGEHTDYVLRDVLGYSAAEVEQLAAANATKPNPETYRPPPWMTRHTNKDGRNAAEAAKARMASPKPRL